LLGFFLLASISRHCAAAGLAGASLLFYAWWDWRLTFLLLGSVLANHMLGRLLARSPRWLPAGVAGNLVLLGYFKYLGFFTGWVSTVLPIGISFYSFTQIAYLVDVARQRARPAV
jgi:D-alanyl-lipoteichoic acid acyltransferase DltB (MBOAT superfamily)